MPTSSASSISSIACWPSIRRSRRPAVEFLGAQFDLGLAWVHFPEGHGGLGLSAQAPEARSTSELSARRRARSRTAATRSATAWARRRSSRTAPTTQKQRYLRPLFTGEEIWCQLFSEPGAGSDVAGLVDARACATATSGSSTARRCGPRSPTSRALGHARRAHRPRAAEAQGHDVLRRRHARAGRRGAAAARRSPARPSSTRSTSPTSASPTASGSATSARAGGCRSRR